LAQSKKHKGDGGDNPPQKPPQKPVAMEGEVLERTSGLGEKAKDTKNAGAPASKPSRAPMIFAGVLLVFIGGLFAAPWAAEGLRSLFPGLMPSEAVQGENSNVAADIAALEARLTTLEASLGRLGERLGGTEVAIDATNDLAGDNSRRIETLAAETSRAAVAGGGVANGATENTDNPVPGSLEVRLSAIEANLRELGETTLALREQNSLDRADGERENAGENIDNIVPAGEGAVVVAGEASMEQIYALEARLQLVEAALAQNPEIRLFPIAVARLARALEGGTAYEGAMLQVRALVVTLPVVERVLAAERLGELDKSATTGIASLRRLNDEFGPLAAIAINAEALGEDASWWEGAWSSIRGLVSVRRTGDIEGASDEALLAQAEMALGGGDLVVASSLVDQLSPLARDVFEDWLGEAGQRLAAQEAMERLIALAFDEQGG
jgi:hypothetical protein